MLSAFRLQMRSSSIGERIEAWKTSSNGPSLPTPRRRASTYLPTYLPTISNENEPGTMGPLGGRPAGPGGALAGGGPYSAVIVIR